MSCGGLGALDVFGDIVNVSEDRRAEAPGLDRFGKVDFLLDSGTHPADLDVGQGFLPTQHKMMGERGQQVFFNLRHKGDGPLAGFGLRFAHHAQISGWVSDRPLDVDGVSVEVEVLPLEAEHFFGAKRMQRRQSDVSPVPVAADVVDVGDQVLHVLHGIRHGCGAGLAVDAETVTVKRTLCDEAIVKSLVENHIEHTSRLVLSEPSLMEIIYTSRGVSVDDRGLNGHDVDDSLYSKDTVLLRYGVGVSGMFDPQTDAVYKKRTESGKEVFAKSVTWLLYTYEDVGQIKFYFDNNNRISSVVWFKGIVETADKEITQMIQEYPESVKLKQTLLAESLIQQAFPAINQSNIVSPIGWYYYLTENAPKSPYL